MYKQRLNNTTDVNLGAETFILNESATLKSYPNPFNSFNNLKDLLTDGARELLKNKKSKMQIKY